MNRSFTRGFTLIELLVVIAIIGILSSVVLASLNSARAKGRDARRVSDLKQLQLAFELFYDACGSHYPAPATSPANTVNGSANNGCPSGTTLANFISSVPTDPQGGAAYVYVSASPYSTYCLGATTENTMTSPSSCTAGSATYKVAP